MAPFTNNSEKKKSLDDPGIFARKKQIVYKIQKNKLLIMNHVIMQS